MSHSSPRTHRIADNLPLTNPQSQSLLSLTLALEHSLNYVLGRSLGAVNPCWHLAPVPYPGEELVFRCQYLLHASDGGVSEIVLALQRHLFAQHADKLRPFPPPN